MIQALTLLGAFGVGIVLSLLGAVKLALAENLNISDAQVGGLISALMFSCVIGALLAGPLVDALGQKRVIVFGFALCGGCILLIANTRSYPVLVTACLLLGVGGLCVSTVSSTLAPVTLFGGKNPSAAQNLNNVFFGLGAFLIPMLVVYLLRPLGFRGTVSLVALLILLPLIPAFLTTYPPLNTGFQFAKAIGLLAQPAILLAGFVLFCYVALEASMAGWITTYLTDLGATAAQAGTVLSLFWVSIMVSRLMAALLMSKSALLTNRPHHAMFVTAVLTVVSIACILMMILAKSTSVGIAAIIIMGLSFGPNFPNVVGITLGRCDRSLWGSAFGIVFAIGLLGATIIPAAIGIYSKGKTIQSSMQIALVTAVVLLGLSVGLWRLCAPRPADQH
jgi:FHS family glucose/mannose:H+ symporter-like MFS transporter